METVSEALIASIGRLRLRDRQRAEQRAAFWRANGSKAGLASARARSANGQLRTHMQKIAASGGRARARTMSAEERRRYSSLGGRASWAKLTPEQARARRRAAGEAANRVLSHEQRVLNAKRGWETRRSRRLAAA